MSQQLALVLVLLAAAIVMFAINRPRMDAVALIMLTALPFTGVITTAEALAGFSDPNIVLIAALFVIGEGLVRTGVARRLGDWLTAKAGSSEVTLLVLLMTAVCGLGSMMSSTGVVAIFIPVALRIAQTTGASPSRLMMPLSVAALISGMTTLIATAPNLVVSSELERHNHQGFHFFAFTPYGVVVLILGIVYMLFARRWLPTANEAEGGTGGRPTLAGWVEEYKLASREHRVAVKDGSPFAGKTLEELRLRSSAGASLVAIERDRKLVQPTAKTELRAGDILFVDLFAQEADVAALREKYALEPMPLSGAYFTDRSQEIGMAEVIVPADSDLVGKTVVEADVRSRFGLTVVGLRHGRIPKEGPIIHEKLDIGDTLLVIGPWKAIRNMQTGCKEMVILDLPVELEEVLPVPGKSIHAVVCLLLMVGLMVSGVVPN